MIVNRITRGRTWWERLEKLLRQLQRALNARIDVIALLKIYIFVQVAANRSGRSGIAEHLDPLHMRDRSFHRHKPLAQILIDTWSGVSVCHKRNSRPKRFRSECACSGYDNRGICRGKSRLLLPPSVAWRFRQVRGWNE